MKQHQLNHSLPGVLEPPCSFQVVLMLGGKPTCKIEHCRSIILRMDPHLLRMTKFLVRCKPVFTFRSLSARFFVVSNTAVQPATTDLQFQHRKTASSPLEFLPGQCPAAHNSFWKQILYNVEKTKSPAFEIPLD